MQFRHHKKRKEIKLTNTFSFRFWHKSEEYICNVTLPVSIEKYRAKEVFDKNFVAQESLPSANPFLSLDGDALYEVLRVKEIANV